MEYPPSFDDGRPDFDHQFAKELIGKHVLVGLTYLNKRGELLKQVQLHGEVVSADARDGILLSLHGTRAGEQYNLPPHTAVFSPAQKGEYSLRSTGETVVDPDYTCTWQVEQADA